MKPDGYTLIEMLVVIAIVALIATLVAPRFSTLAPDPSAASVSLSSYLNSAASYASSHETQVCLAKSGNQITSQPGGQVYTVPDGLEVGLSPFCYDAKGRVGSAFSISLSNVKGESASVRVETGYGNVRPE